MVSGRNVVWKFSFETMVNNGNTLTDKGATQNNWHIMENLKICEYKPFPIFVVDMCSSHLKIVQFRIIEKWLSNMLMRFSAYLFRS